jgi:CPA1 family monovalent cation:H+ antiporter
MIGHTTPRFTSGASRLQATAVWHLADFLLQGFVFLLIGQQIVPVVRGLKAYPASTIWAAAAVSLGVVLLLRPLWLALTQSLPRALRARRGRRPAAGGDGFLSGREIAVLSWAGTRGVITLAAVFTLPLTTSDGRPFPGRDLLLFCAFLVVVFTLIGQGLTFGPVARLLGVRADLADAALVRTQARAASVQAGLSRLDQITADEAAPGAALGALRTSLEAKARRYRQLLGRLEAGEDAVPASTPEYQAAVQARRSVIDAQREELLRWRDAGHLPDASLRILERELDHEERTLPPHESH